MVDLQKISSSQGRLCCFLIGKLRYLSVYGESSIMFLHLDSSCLILLNFVELTQCLTQVMVVQLLSSISDCRHGVAKHFQGVWS
jgi:hypothetical protein